MSELKPCPFCNMVFDDDLEDVLYPSGHWRVDDGLRHYLLPGDSREPHGRTWKFVCSESAGGCGCSVYGHSKAEAIEAWNRRAQPAQAGQVLTDDEVARIVADCAASAHRQDDFSFARAIEAAVLAKRVPMTNAQIRRLYAESWSTAAGADFQQAVRAAEKFHGIVGEKGGA